MNCFNKSLFRYLLKRCIGAVARRRSRQRQFLRQLDTSFESTSSLSIICSLVVTSRGEATGRSRPTRSSEVHACDNHFTRRRV